MDFWKIIVLVIVLNGLLLVANVASFNNATELTFNNIQSQYSGYLTNPAEHAQQVESYTNPVSETTDSEATWGRKSDIQDDERSTINSQTSLLRGSVESLKEYASNMYSTSPIMWGAILIVYLIDVWLIIFVTMKLFNFFIHGKE